MDAYQEVERLLAEISQALKSPDLIRKTEAISVLCRAYMEPSLAGEGHNIGLTKSEARIFDILLARRGRPVTRSALMDVSCHNPDSDADIKIIDVHVYFLRQHLKGTKYEGMIETVYSLGYRMRLESEGQYIVKSNRSRHHKPSAAALTQLKAA